MKRKIPWIKFKDTPCSLCGHTAEDHFFNNSGCSSCKCRKFHPHESLRIRKKKERRL
jgi:hypothetical protein